jgi:hypothetical protein
LSVTTSNILTILSARLSTRISFRDWSSCNRWREPVPYDKSELHLGGTTHLPGKRCRRSGVRPLGRISTFFTVRTTSLNIIMRWLNADRTRDHAPRAAMRSRPHSQLRNGRQIDRVNHTPTPEANIWSESCLPRRFPSTRRRLWNSSRSTAQSRRKRSP